MWIPLNRPYRAKNAFSYIQEAIMNGHLSGDGPFTKLCHAFFEKTLSVRKTLLTTSCTHALEMASMLLDIQPGDEIIAPSFTFVSTLNAFVLRGARPVFIDIREDTLNMDENLIESLITPKTKAIVPVHYAGVACEMDRIAEIARKYQIEVVEDNAHGLFGYYKGKALGSIGALGTESFHETKNFSSGEGGALFINDEKFIDRAEILREKGTDRSRFFRDMVDKYTWIDAGSSYLPSDLLAAYLYSQLEIYEDIQARRKVIWDTYFSHFSERLDSSQVILPTVPKECDQSYHLFYLLLPTLGMRQEFIQSLKKKGITAAFHYLPLHLSKMGQSFGGKEGQCPVTEQMSDRLVRLPLYYDLSQEEQQRVIDAVVEFFKPVRVSVASSFLEQTV